MPSCLLLVLMGAMGVAADEEVTLFETKGVSTHTTDTGPSDYLSVCYFTNWARYRSGLINKGDEDVFEMGLDADLCTHLMYGFVSVFKDAATGHYALRAHDPYADHPSGSEQQTTLCPEQCNNPNFRLDWNDPSGVSCGGACSPSRKYRGFEGATVAMKRKNPSLKTIVSAGGWNFNDCSCAVGCYGQGAKTCEIFSTIAASEAETRQFAKNILAFCRNWGFDGFDLDWEYPVVAGHNSLKKDANGDFVATPQDYDNYINMLRILREEFHAENPSNPLVLTAAVGVGKPIVEAAYNIPAMIEHLDLINLMTYDLHGAWEPHTGCNANLFSTQADIARDGYAMSVSWGVDHWIKHTGAPGKLTMGFGAYGRGWKLSDPSNASYGAPGSGASEGGPSTKAAGVLSYYEIENEINNKGATRHYDNERQCPYIVTTSGEWFGYDDKQSLQAKLDYVKSKGLSGTMVWALDLDNFADGYTLISYAREYLRGDSPPVPTTLAPTTAPTTLAPTTAPTTLAPTTAPTTLAPTPEPPTPTPGACDAIDGNQHGCTNDSCQQCLEGYQWWPCNVVSPPCCECVAKQRP